MTSASINTLKIYEVNEHTLEDDYHIVTGIFTELSLAQSVKPLKSIELVIINEMSLHDGQFFPTGYTYYKEIELDEEGNQVWSRWVERYNKPIII
jgi:hypothetical protein